MEEINNFVPQIDLDNKSKYYKRRYSMNIVGGKGSTTTVAIPPAVIERKAEENGMTPEEFIKAYKIVAIYNGFDGVFYTFEEKTKEELELDASKKVT